MCSPQMWYVERGERPGQDVRRFDKITKETLLTLARVTVARRDERQEQRRAARKEAERQSRIAWQNNISMEDPDRVNRMNANYQPRVRKPNV